MAEIRGLYRAFGIDFQSPMELPEMRQGWEGKSPPVTIALGMAAQPQTAVQLETGVAAGPGIFWMDVPGVARLLVADGISMTVEIAPNARETNVRAFLLGSALGALLHQRGLFPIHASAVEIDGKAILFAGASGAGKSTMATHLSKRGHAFLCDDISAVDLTGPHPVIWPGLHNAKLWHETLNSVGESPTGLERVLPSLDKYRLPIANAAAYRACPVGTIFRLASSATCRSAEILRLSGADAVGLLVANTFRGQLVVPMTRQRAHFDACVGLARAIPVAELTRPWAISGIDDICAVVEAEVGGQETTEDRPNSVPRS